MYYIFSVRCSIGQKFVKNTGIVGHTNFLHCYFILIMWECGHSTLQLIVLLMLVFRLQSQT